MRRSTIVLVLVFFIAAGGVGVAGGVILTSRPSASPPLTGLPETQPVDSLDLETTTSVAEPTTTVAPATTAPATLALRLARRLEDGVQLRIDASEPVVATIRWGFTQPSGNMLPLPATVLHATATLPLATARAVQVRVTGTTRDGRPANSQTITVQRLVRRATLRVVSARLAFSDGTATLRATFLGTTLTLVRNGRAPGAGGGPVTFPPGQVAPNAFGTPLGLQLVHTPASGAARSGTATVPMPVPSSPVAPAPFDTQLVIADVDVHLTLQVTITVT
jgi:hypothetical protein